MKKEPYPPSAGRTAERSDPLETPGPSASSKPTYPASLRQPPSPYDARLSLAAIAWLRELPQQVAPQALARQFPRIVNRLARFWDSPQMIDQYLTELLVDRRGRRKGFPDRVLEELHRLDKFHRARRHAPSSDLWESIPDRVPRDR